jgi:hypothetical protein
MSEQNIDPLAALQSAAPKQVHTHSALHPQRPPRRKVKLSDQCIRVYIAVAIAVFIGGVMPICVPSMSGATTVWPQFQLLSQDNAPASIVLWLIWPMLAGAALLVTRLCTKKKPLPILSICLSCIFPLLFMYICRDVFRMLGAMPVEMRTQFYTIMAWASTGCLWMLGIYTGLRIQAVHPTGRFGRRMAGISGALLLIWYVLPIFPAESGRVAIAMPFQSLEATGISFGWFALSICPVLVLFFPAIVACVSGWRKKPLGTSRIAFVARMIYLLYIPYLFLLMQYAMLSKLPEGSSVPASLWFAPIPNAIKVSCLICGMAGMISVGVVHLYALKQERRDRRTPTSISD